MTDIGFKLDMFRDAYDQAVSAFNAGEVERAKRLFMRAAELMDEIADASEPPLKAKRKERADKLRYLGENLSVQGAPEGGADRDEARKFLHVTTPTERVSFDDIIGLDEAKAAIHRLLIDPLKNPDAFKKYGLKAGGYILLEGPPGTGKTTFAKAAASELDVPFADVNANELVDSYIGKTGKNIDALFDEARAAAKAAGKPIVIFIDEIDYLAQKRGGENKTAGEAVPTLIKQMDGFSTDSDDLVLIAATNIRSSLDPAILSRFRNVISIPLPNADERERILRAKLAMLDRADFDVIDFSTVAAKTDGMSGRDLNRIALELKAALASRDAGLRPLDKALTDILIDAI